MAHDESDDAGGDDDDSGESGHPAVGTRFTADEIYENVRVAADDELRRAPAGLFWSALSAGATIGFSFLAAGVLGSLASPAHRTLLAALGYPLGFAFVVIARSQLFTENTLEPVLPLLHAPSVATARRLGVLWAAVLAGNLAGAMLFALALARTDMIDGDAAGTLVELARASTRGGFAHVFYRAIFAGWLVALMAWLVSSARSTGAQIALIWLTTAPIAALGFRHSIAGAVEAFYGALTHAITWSTALVGFLVPALLGNVVGGVVLVALLNYGQVAAGRTDDDGDGDAPARDATRPRSSRG